MLQNVKYAEELFELAIHHVVTQKHEERVMNRDAVFNIQELPILPILPEIIYEDKEKPESKNIHIINFIKSQ